MPAFRVLISLCAAAGLLTALTACAVFRLPTLQGNVIEQKQVDQLETGMTPDQVRFLIGSPLVQGSFDPNRWDYVYYYRSPAGVETRRALNLYFDNGKLARIVGQDAPATSVPATAGTRPQADTAADKTAETTADPVNNPATEVPTTIPEPQPVDNSPLPDRLPDNKPENLDDSISPP